MDWAGASSGEAYRELAAVKAAIQLDDERLRRALTSVSALNCEHIAIAAARLREEVSQLNQLRTIVADQVRGLTASNVLLKELAAPQRGPSEQTDSTRLMSTLNELTRLETARLSGLEDEKQVLRAELQRLRDECKTVSRDTELERSRQQNAQDQCQQLQVALEYAAGGIETQQLQGLLMEAVRELNEEGFGAEGTGGDQSRRSTKRRANQRRRLSRSHHNHRTSTSTLHR